MRHRRPRGLSAPLVLTRYLGAAALLAVGADHLDQYTSAHYDAVPTIGTLFVLNFVSATLVAAGTCRAGRATQPSRRPHDARRTRARRHRHRRADHSPGC